MGLPGHSQGRSGLPVSAKVGSRGGSAPKGAGSAGVSRGLRVRAFSAITVTPAGLLAARALESCTWGISSSELYDASSRQPVRSSLQGSLTLRHHDITQPPPPLSCSASFRKAVLLTSGIKLPLQQCDVGVSCKQGIHALFFTVFQVTAGMTDIFTSRS